MKALNIKKGEDRLNYDEDADLNDALLNLQDKSKAVKLNSYINNPLVLNTNNKLNLIDNELKSSQNNSNSSDADKNNSPDKNNLSLPNQKEEPDEPRIFKKKFDEWEFIEGQCKSKEEIDKKLLLYEVEKLHLRKWNKKIGLLEKIKCCTSTGCFGCCKANLNSDLNTYGIAVMVYFRSLKALIYTFLVITILQSCLAYLYFTTSLNTTNVSGFNLFNTVNKFSLGNRPLSIQMCNKIPVSDFLTFDNYNLTLSCNTNQTIRIGFFGLSKLPLIETKNSDNCLNNSYNSIINIDTACDLTTWLKTKYTVNCGTQRFCSIVTTTTKNEHLSCDYDKVINQYLYLTYTCDFVYNRFPSLPFIETNFFLIKGTIDALSMVCLLICLSIINKDSKVTENIYRSKFYSVDSFTVRIKNLGIKTNDVFRYVNTLTMQISRVLKFGGNININEEDKIKNKNLFMTENKTPIYEINFNMFNHNILELLIKKEKLNDLLQDQISKYENFKHTDGYSIDIPALENKIRILKNNIAEHVTKIKFLDKNEAKWINDIYITFKEIKTAKKFYNLYKNKNRCTRCCLILFCTGRKINYLYVDNHWLNLELNPECPSNIKWQNVGYQKFCGQFCIKTVNFIFCFFMFLIGLGIVYILKINLEAVDNEFISSIDCKYVNYTNYTTITNGASYSISSLDFLSDDNLILNFKFNRENSAAFCFCQNLFYTSGYANTINFNILISGNKITPCSDWVKSYSNLITISYLILIAIPFFNLILRIVFKILTKLERNKSVIDEKFSLFYKIFFLNFLITSVNFLLINIYIQQVNSISTSIPILNGMYKDFSLSWYLNIGTVITLLMVVNIFEPHLANICHVFFNYCRRIKESGNIIGVNSKRNTKSAFFDLYLGPEFNIEIRYANVSNYI